MGAAAGQHRGGVGDSSSSRRSARSAADVKRMDTGLARLRAHATAMLLIASAALAASSALAPNARDGALVVPACAFLVATAGAVVSWFWGERLSGLGLAAFVLLATGLVTESVALGQVSMTSELLVFVAPIVFAACFLPVRLVLAALIASCTAYGWLVSRQLSGAGELDWVASATLVLASATATVALLRRELTATLLELAGLARRDPLTGLLNRRSFDQTLERELERCARTGETCALLMCDLDYFKLINDGHGHGVGDAVLRRVAADLLAGVRAIDTVARVGGEEIALLLIDCSGRAAARVAERLRRRVARERPGEPSVTLSIGVADSTLAPSPGELLACADQALYDAKRAGRDRVCRASGPPRRSLVLAA
jgi:diguanylate cyclase (GGDEF)-like protein